MKSSNKVAGFFRELRTKLRVSVRDPHNDREKWYIFLSPLNVLTALVALVVLLFVVVISIVAFTPALDFVPGYQGSKARNMLINYNLKLDSLENELVHWNRYYENLTRIMDGKAPLMSANPELDSTALAQRTEVARIPEDSVLRGQLEGDGAYGLNQSAPRRENVFPRMYQPLKGVVRAKFDPRTGRYGTDVAVAESQPVMSIMDGVVIRASWTPAEGSVIYILHPGNIISAYLHNASLTKKTGDRVYSGEVVAFTGSSLEDGDDAGYTEIQLWINGTPVDPENYIIF
ncbi:M23 family metallopeptidase [Alistipes sp. OttesenSCG-928-L06]|nr:M23 family metallopeptidase [Alistipes sp. OttesenSCG-928-L06]